MEDIEAEAIPGCTWRLLDVNERMTTRWIYGSVISIRHAGQRATTNLLMKAIDEYPGVVGSRGW